MYIYIYMVYVHTIRIYGVCITNIPYLYICHLYGTCKYPKESSRTRLLVHGKLYISATLQFRLLCVMYYYYSTFGSPGRHDVTRPRGTSCDSKTLTLENFDQYGGGVGSCGGARMEALRCAPAVGNICMYVIRMYVCNTYVCFYVCIYTYTYTHTLYNTHTHTHT